MTLRRTHPWCGAWWMQKQRWQSASVQGDRREQTWRWWRWWQVKSVWKYKNKIKGVKSKDDDDDETLHNFLGSSQNTIELVSFVASVWWVRNFLRTKFQSAEVCKLKERQIQILSIPYDIVVMHNSLIQPNTVFFLLLLFHLLLLLLTEVIPSYLVFCRLTVPVLRTFTEGASNALKIIGVSPVSKNSSKTRYLFKEC